MNVPCSLLNSLYIFRVIYVSIGAIAPPAGSGAECRFETGERRENASRAEELQKVRTEPRGRGLIRLWAGSNQCGRGLTARWAGLGRCGKQTVKGKMQRGACLCLSMCRRCCSRVKCIGFQSGSGHRRRGTDGRAARGHGRDIPEPARALTETDAGSGAKVKPTNSRTWGPNPPHLLPALSCGCLVTSDPTY